MLNAILFTHNDLDGAGCAVVFSVVMKAHGSEFQVIHCSNNEVDKKVQEAWDKGIFSEGTYICFGDICPSKEMTEKLQEHFPTKVRIWDHHKNNLYIPDIIPGAIIMPEENPEGKLECGASLVYKYFQQFPQLYLHVIPLLTEFVENVRSYDTYEWKKTNNVSAQKLDTLMDVLGLERFVNKYIERILDCWENIIHGSMDQQKYYPLIEEKYFECIDAKLEQEQKVIDALTIDDVKVVTIKGLKAAIRYSGTVGINEVANQFLTKYPEFDVFIDLGISGGYYSFRTIKDGIDVESQFATPLGGGGHLRAAGAPIPKNLQEEIFNLLIDHISNSK